MYNFNQYTTANLERLAFEQKLNVMEYDNKYLRNLLIVILSK